MGFLPPEKGDILITLPYLMGFKIFFPVKAFSLLFFVLYILSFRLSMTVQNSFDPVVDWSWEVFILYKIVLSKISSVWEVSPAFMTKEKIPMKE